MKRSRFDIALLLAGLVGGIGMLVALNAADKPVETKPTEEKTLTATLKKATVDGKYQMLLRQFKYAEDKDNYGDFSEYGLYGGTTYAGFNDLPKGYWVYVSPYWYIWRETKADAAQMPKRAWGPEQVIGQPDTDMAGDIQTAWASQTQDGQPEWLLVEFAEAVLIKEVLVHETYNPGAVTRATAFKLDGTEVELWAGKDPSEGKDIGMSVLEVKKPVRASRVKIYIESPKVMGWNEIDAVGVKDEKGKTHWAVSVEASSTYAQQQDPATAKERRVRELEREVRELKDKIKKLEELLEKKDK